MRRFRGRRDPGMLLIAVLLSILAAGAAPAWGQGGSRPFPETGHPVAGRFLAYWDGHGGLAQQGYPLTDEVTEVSPTDGRPYTMQYFERAIFERHPENAPPYDVLLSLLGVFAYQERYGAAGAPGQVPNQGDNPRYFAATGHTLGGKFRAYWESHGGLAQQGYPLSDEFQEKSALDGKTYTVQYFERAVFEWHPENAGTPYEVLLSQLGTFRYRARYSLALPAPDAGRYQIAPHGSGRYLAWTDTAWAGQPSPPAPDAPPARLRAFDLQAGQPVTIAEQSGNVEAAAVAGSLVVWQQMVSQQEGATGCPPGCVTTVTVRVKDLASGALYEIATLPATATGAVAVSGRQVAWLDSSGQKIGIKALDTGTTTQVVTLGGAWDTLTQFVFDGPNLAWIVKHYEPTGTYDVHVYNLATRQTRTVATGTAPFTERQLGLALAGQRLVWTDPVVHLADLASGAVTQLAAGVAFDPAIQGDTVVWSTKTSALGTDRDLVGLRLPGGTPVVLATGAGNQQAATLSGEWLVWQNEGGPQDGRLGARRVSEAFAGAPALRALPVQGGQAIAPIPSIASIPPGVVSAGHYLFWIDTDVIGYDLAQQRRYSVTSDGAPAGGLATDGQTLAWWSARGERIDGYDPQTRQRRALVSGLGQESDTSPLGLALDNGILYYPKVVAGQPGLYAYTLATRQETQITAHYALWPVAGDGVVLWQEIQSEGRCRGCPSTYDLHLHRQDGTTNDTLLPTGGGTFTGYGAAGGRVVWGLQYGGAGLYNRADGTTLRLTAADVSGAVIRGGTVVWSEMPSYGTSGWNVRRYELATGATTVLFGGLVPYTQVRALPEAGLLVFTQGAYNEPKALYTQPLPGR